MGYSAEVVRRARARLAQEKEDRESENRQHLALAYEKVPRIREIDHELRVTMAKTAQAAFLSGSDGRDALLALREQNKGLQQERERLAREHFEEGFLDDAPICAVCGGSGYVGTAMCQCLMELCRQEQKREVSILSGSRDSFSHFELSYYPDRPDPKYGVSPRTVMEKNLRDCRNYAASFSAKSENLLFSGNTGLGKTFLSGCIARTVADRGFSVAYETASRLFTKMERARFERDEQCRLETEGALAADLLILDDLGTEMTTAFVQSALYQIVNTRLMEKRSTIINTNLTPDKLAQRYTPQIASRIEGEYQLLAFVGEDIRKLKRKR